MSKVSIQITGSLIACSEGVRDDWRNITNWLKGKLKILYGDQVEVEYFDLFDNNRPELPKDAKLPVILINNEVISMGEKISIPLIKTKLKTLGLIKY
ncbi:MAG TPA: hypothetical protein VMW28_08490 [Pelolinea sp.]|nr:hypothetical protein [Pelolinea sp.]